MKYFLNLSLMITAMSAVLSDLKTGKIPNGLLAAGFLCGAAFQWIYRGFPGILLFTGGAVLPVVLFALFYYLRMLGAGDIKLMSVIGGFLGPSDCFGCIAASLFFAGIISAGFMIYHKNLRQRMNYFFRYVEQCSKERKWTPYLSEVPESAGFCFSIPVLLGVIYCILQGGII